MADNDQAARGPEDIRRDIDEARESMRETINALQTRLDPQRLKQEAADKVRAATIGRVEELADNASDTVKGVGNDVFETIKQNPIPAALAAIGLGWLFMERRNTRDTYRYDRYPESRRFAGYRNRMDYQDYGEYDSGSERPMTRRAMDQVQQTKENVQQKVGDVADQTREKVSDIADQTREQVGEWADSAQYRMQRAKSGFENLLEENPLLVGAAALAVGAAIGLSIPSTRQEAEFMGDTRDKLVDKVQDAAQDTMGKVQRVAEEATSAAKDAAKQEAQKQDLPVSGHSS